MNQRPNVIEALSEALRRIYAVQYGGGNAASKWDAYKAVLAYQKELTDASLDRISEGVDEWEKMQLEAEADRQAQDEAYHSLRCAGQPR